MEEVYLIKLVCMRQDGTKAIHYEISNERDDLSMSEEQMIKLKKLINKCIEDGKKHERRRKNIHH